MSTEATTNPTGHVHDVLVYGSDDELLDAVVPHLRSSVAAGEPAFVALEDREAAMVRTLVDDAGVTFLPPLSRGRPPTAIRRTTSSLAESLGRGVERIQVVNAVPHPGLGAPWDGWCRYEAAVNDLFAAQPVGSLCLYDRRVTPDHVLHDVERTHPHLAAPGGTHVPNARYEEPSAFVRSIAAPPDPFEADPPLVRLIDPAPATARQAIRDVARRTVLHPDVIGDLLLATTEAVTNGVAHGRPPIAVRVWAADERIVVAVTDQGQGPTDPCAGLVAATGDPEGQSGYGLWIMHQLVAVTYARDVDSFTLRLVAGDEADWRPPSTKEP